MTSSKKTMNNIIDSKVLRRIQKNTLDTIAKSLATSFGPYGTNSILCSKMADTTDRFLVSNYTKDGNDILKHIQFDGVVEMSIKNDLLDITKNNLMRVGDSTTSSIILSKFVFDALVKYEEDHKDISRQQLIDKINDIIMELKLKIMDESREFTGNTAHDITFISTNGNKEIATEMGMVYDRYGEDVYIDILTSNDKYSYVKEFNGMTLDVGFSDTAYINNETGESIIEYPKVYAFKDPIDTPQMGNFLDKIIKDNIIDPLIKAQMETEKTKQRVEPKFVNTVVFAPKISRDFSPLMKRICDIMYTIKAVETKPPLLIVTNLFDDEAVKYDDINILCGCKQIGKYIDPEIYEKDVKEGLAPTMDNIHDFAGSCTRVTSNAIRTIVFEPSAMYKEDGEISDTYNNLLMFAKSNLEKIKNETNNLIAIRKAKKRLNSLNMSMIEYYVGGISPAERESRRALVEDAVLNCRSAAEYGVGLASNLEAFKAINKIDANKFDKELVDMVKSAIVNVISLLYKVSNSEFTEEIQNKILKDNIAYDLRAKEFSNNVLSSIETDIVTLEGAFKIITMIFTSAQFILPDVMDNWYPEYED